VSRRSSGGGVYHGESVRTRRPILTSRQDAAYGPFAPVAPLGHPHALRPHTGLWGVVRGRCCVCLAPPLGSPAPLPPAADHPQSDSTEDERLHGQPVKTGHPRVANSPSSIAVACRVLTLTGPSGQRHSSTNRKGDPKADRRALGVGALMRRAISTPQENAGCRSAEVCATNVTSLRTATTRY
jgi:hypothetical protein